MTPISVFQHVFGEDVLDSFVGVLHLTVPLQMIGSGLDVVDVIGGSEDSQYFIDKFSSLVCCEDLWDPMSADHIFIEERCDGLCIIVFQGSDFNPFGEVIDSDNDVAFS